MNYIGFMSRDAASREVGDKKPVLTRLGEGRCDVQTVNGAVVLNNYMHCQAVKTAWSSTQKGTGPGGFPACDLRGC